VGRWLEREGGAWREAGTHRPAINTVTEHAGHHSGFPADHPSLTPPSTGRPDPRPPVARAVRRKLPAARQGAGGAALESEAMARMVAQLGSEFKRISVARK
jgi:hypothetical protein